MRLGRQIKKILQPCDPGFVLKDCSYCKKAISGINQGGNYHSKNSYDNLKSCQGCAAIHRASLYATRSEKVKSEKVKSGEKMPIGTRSMIVGIPHKVGHLGFIYRENINGGWSKVEVCLRQFRRGLM